MTREDEELLAEFRYAREKRDTAAFTGSITREIKLDYLRALDSLRLLSDLSLRTLAVEALEYLGTQDDFRGRIAEQLLAEYLPRPIRTIN